MLVKRFILIILLGLSWSVYAKIDLVTLPNRDQVQLTIYNSADLTLVREQRILTLKQGLNRLEFSWADTLIDPTSIQFSAPQHPQDVHLIEATYPPNIQRSVIWTIESKIGGEIPVEITFFTSGISWQSFYMATLSPDEQTMHLQNYVHVANQSGEDYQQAQTRVIVGKINLLDQIAVLAQRDPPYGNPQEQLHDKNTLYEDSATYQEGRDFAVGSARAVTQKLAALKPKQIIKEGLSEYFLYTIEGTESIINGWSKRLLAFEASDIPVVALYRYDEARYGSQVQQLLFFKNDKLHHLGSIPLPDGDVTVYRQLDKNQQFSYVGASTMQYIPIGQEAELQLGSSPQIKVEPVLMNMKTTEYMFDNKGYISGFDKVQQWEIQLENNRDLPVAIEIFRHTDHSYWEIENAVDDVKYYEKVDVDTFKYRLTLPPYTKQILHYTLTSFEGERRQNH